jgi:RNA polymerase sigma-70 factor (ECF subfamily)
MLLDLRSRAARAEAWPALALLAIRTESSSHLAGVPGQISSLACPGSEALVGTPSLDALRIAAPAPTPTALRMPRTDARLRAAVANHVALVWRVLRRTGLGSADAEDASQDVFWVLAQRFDDVPERAQRSFLVSTALRVASDRKHSKWHRSVSSGLDVEARVSDALLPDEALDLRRASALLDEALATLEEFERAVFVLAELEQMTRAEVAEVLGIPEGTVASRLKRARESLEVAVRRLRSRPRAAR